MDTKQEVVMYKVHSGVRKVHTRATRRKTPGRARFVQRLLGGAVIVRRVRPATITKTQLLDNLEEFKVANKEGRIEVKTVTGELIDLETMTPIEKAPAPPKPHPPLDSIANDKTFEHGVGRHMPKYPDGKGIAEDASLLAPKGLVEDDEAVEPLPEDSGTDPAAARKKHRNKKKKK